MNNPWIIGEWDIVLRLCLAMVLGGLIGFEREFNNHAAGLRTNILVCVGSTLIMLLSMYGFSDFLGEENVRVDPARLATAVISGVGFLGAGTILFTGKSITGLTTAASLWVVASIGLAIGAGFYFAGILSTVLVVLILWVFNKIELRYLNGKKIQILTIQTEMSSINIDAITSAFDDRAIVLKKMSMRTAHQRMECDEMKQMDFVFHLIVPKAMGAAELLSVVTSIDGLVSIEIE